MITFSRAARSAVIIFTILSALIVGRPSSVSAQDASPTPSYWRHAASGKLDSVLTVDIDADGVHEVLILDELSRLTLLSADGQILWSFNSSHPVIAVGAVDPVTTNGDFMEIALVGPKNLSLLDHTGKRLWQIPLNIDAQPVSVTGYDFQNDGINEILVLFETGQLFVFTAAGGLVWQFAGQDDLNIDVNPKMLVSDFDGDGAQEIVLGLFTPRRFSQLLFIDDETVRWRQSISRRITALVEAPFRNDQTYIALGTNFGQVDLYDTNGELIWFRTINKPISAMTFASSARGPSLIAGTETGSVTSFSEEGRREWSSNLASNADRQVLALLPAAITAETMAARNSFSEQGRPHLAVLLATNSSTSELADILLVGNEGQTLAKIDDTDLPYLTHLIDINHDGYHELLLPRFASLQLIGLGVGNSEYIKEWEYDLGSAPTALLVHDTDGDGEEEITVGTRNGRVHSLGTDRGIRWLHALDGEISQLIRIRHQGDRQDSLLIVRQPHLDSENSVDPSASPARLELRTMMGELIWDVTMPVRVSALAIVEPTQPEVASIYIGTADGQVLAYDGDGRLVWSNAILDVEDRIDHLLVLTGRGTRPDQLLIADGASIQALSLDAPEGATYRFAQFTEPIIDMFEVRQPGNELSVNLVVFTEEGSIHGLNRRGIEMAHRSWPYQLNALPGAIEIWDESATEVFQSDFTAFLVATEEGSIEQIAVEDNQPIFLWRIEGLGVVETMNWDDINEDGRPESSLIGTRDGQVFFLDQLQTRAPHQTFDLSLNSSLFNVSFLKRSSSQSPNLLAITQNGIIRMFREEENRPPLLIFPRVEEEQNQFGFSVQVIDVENDPVAVRLELRDADGTWLALTEQTLEDGNGSLFWPVTSFPQGTDQINYRFRFEDGIYQGFLTPPPGPVLPASSAFSEITMRMIAPAGVVFIAGLALFIRQSQTPGAQAGRFYRQLRQRPGETLPLLENRYALSNGSPDFLLQLANQARRATDSDVANLSDGLFLLANRPQAGLSIITRTLDEMPESNDKPDLEHRRLIYKTAQALLEAPSITELSLLRPQLVHLQAVAEENDEWSPIFDSLLPILSNMRDSERVESINDRLVYLNQAATRLRLVQDQLQDYSPSVERTLVKAIARRWTGLITAEIEEQRGRAELEVILKTKRLAPSEQIFVEMDLRNTGRAAAENIIAVLENNPAYKVCSDPQVIPFLPPGRSRQVRFLIQPAAEERFRVALSLTYDDRNRQEKTAAFGDMVHLLPPTREFTPIANPYLPGTPLRKDSPLFYGREELFDFIAGNTGLQSQRNVLMLVGQRRTGKTSALLRLEEYLPPQLIPVYIDCQSLGVLPGMASLLQEFAWYIADTLANRGLSCPVPDYSDWQEDPARVFQRRFLPEARNLLPPGSTLLLVFDEFEAFESMVADGILPSTVFTYLRHLMQHSDWLSFIFVGTQRLEEMSADYWSVLFNTALYRKIDYLSDVAATRLICEPVSPAIVYDDLAIDKILRVTAGHPYFLQLVCYTLVKHANQNGSGYVTISDVNAALDEMLRLGEVHFAYLWQRSSYVERAILSAVAQLMDRNEPLHPTTLIEYLQTFSIELDPAEITTSLNSLVQRDILREVTEEGYGLYELRIGLVGIWVSQNKSLSRLLAHLDNDSFVMERDRKAQL